MLKMTPEASSIRQEPPRHGQTIGNKSATICWMLNIKYWTFVILRAGLERGIPDPDEGGGGNAAAARLHRHALLILIPQPVSCSSFFKWPTLRNQLDDDDVVANAELCFSISNSLSEFSDENMMDPYNLAICFGPTLVPVPEDKDQVQFQNLVNELIKNIIINSEDIFPVDGGVVYERYISREPDEA